MKEPNDVSNTDQPNSQALIEESVVLPTDDKPSISSTDCPIDYDVVQKWIAGTDEKLSKLLILFEEKIKDDTVKNDLFSKLYNDLTNYRQDFIFKNITKRVFTDVISLFDRVDGMLQPKSLDQMKRDDFIEHIRSFRGEIIQILRRQEVCLIENKSEQFNDTFQEAIDVQLVNILEEDQKVISVVRKGFNYRNNLFRPEEVIISKYSKLEEELKDG